MKKILIILTIIVGVALFIFREYVNAFSFALFYGKKYEEVITTGTPREASSMINKALKAKVKGELIIDGGVSTLLEDAAKNPDAEVLDKALDNELFNEELKEDAEERQTDINSLVFMSVIYKKNAPEKVQVLLEHGYNPYKHDDNNKYGAIDVMRMTSDKIDPEVFYVINNYYR